MAWIRLCWFLLLFLLYCTVELGVGSDYDVTSAMRQETVDEFFPDAGKASERLKEGEVTAGFKEQLHADDVAQTLNWYTTFCKDKAAADDHIRDAWRCNLVQVSIRNLHKPRWDPFENRALIDDDADNYLASKSKHNLSLHTGLYEKRTLTAAEKVKRDKSLEAIDRICDPSFLRWHLVIGDDPVPDADKKNKPWSDFGNTDSFRENILRKAGIDDISDDYDQFTVEDHYSQWEDEAKVNKQVLGIPDSMDRIEKRLGEIERKLDGQSFVELDGAGHTIARRKLTAELKRDADATAHALLELDQGLSPRSQRRFGISKPVSEVHQDDWDDDEDAIEARLHRTRRGKRHPTISRHSKPSSFQQLQEEHGMRTAKHAEAMEDEAETREDSQRDADEAEANDDSDDEGDPYGTGCFQKFDLGQLRDSWLQHDTDFSMDLDAEESKKLIDQMYPDSAPEVIRELDSDGDGTVTIEEYVKHAIKHPDKPKLDPRGYLTDKCRNHHWGLVSLCKPELVAASYRVQQVTRQEGGKVLAGPYLDVDISFSSLGEKMNSGWYRGRINIKTAPSVNGKGLISFISMNIVIILIHVMIAWDFLVTCALLPASWMRLLRFRQDASNKTLNEEAIDLWDKIAPLFDGRRVRIHFMSVMFVALENCILIMFYIAVFVSVLESFTPVMLPGSGNQSDDCKAAFLSVESEWIVDSIDPKVSGPVDLKRGLSMYKFLSNCVDGGVSSWLTELEYEILFSCHDRLHVWVISLIMLRALAALNHWKRLEWLPTTMYLARQKLLYFLVLYMLLVAGFALSMELHFGELYVQYSNFFESFITLFLFSFGSSERALDGVHAFMERSGTVVTIYLLLFTVVVITVALNFFTTIVLDAFTTAQQSDEEVAQACEDEFVIALSALTPWFRLPAKERDGAVDDDDDDEGPSEIAALGKHSKRRKDFGYVASFGKRQQSPPTQGGTLGPPPSIAAVSSFGAPSVETPFAAMPMGQVSGPSDASIPPEEPVPLLTTMPQAAPHAGFTPAPLPVIGGAPEAAGRRLSNTEFYDMAQSDLASPTPLTPTDLVPPTPLTPARQLEDLEGTAPLLTETPPSPPVATAAPEDVPPEMETAKDTPGGDAPLRRDMRQSTAGPPPLP